MSEPHPWLYLPLFLGLLGVALYARSRNAEDFSPLLENGWVARGFGLFLVLFGMGMGYLLLAQPIQEALHGGDRILVRRGSGAVPTLLVVCGTTLLIAGSSAQRVLSARSGRMTELQWVITAIGILTCLVVEFGLLEFLRAIATRHRSFVGTF